VKFRVAIDRFIEDMRLEGRINSPATERDYRGTLGKHCDDVKNRDPAKTGRDDVKKTLARWPHANSRSKNHSIITVFYDWMIEEGLRDTNPARAVRRARRRTKPAYRLTTEEKVALMQAATGERERRVIFLGLCAGLRRGELRGLRGAHFARPGFVHVSSDIAKGGKERWVPVSDELAPVVDEIRATVADDEYIVCAQRWRNPPENTQTLDKRTFPASEQAIWRLVKRVGARASLAQPISPHKLRHAFADAAAKKTTVQTVAALLGHANVSTTQTYLGQPSPEELRSAMSGFALGYAAAQRLSRAIDLANPVEAPTGIEPV
jgi:integrase/recombinase XerD